MSGKTYGDWFSGFGGMTIGASIAGFEPVFACEYEPEIAGVYVANLGKHMTVANLLTLDNGISHPRYPRTKNGRKRRLQDMQGDWFRRALAAGAKHSEFTFTSPHFPYVDWKHDSPPCPNFSVAKKDAEEGIREIALAVRCCEYLIYARPKFYSLENVYGYRRSESFRLILRTLDALGYGRSYWHLNAADYGVPQTRQRLVLMARLDGQKPQRPTATHQKEAQNNFAGSLFGDAFTLKPWVSWHDAIADLLNSLPDSQFADWQLKRMPADIQEMVLIDHTSAIRPATVLDCQQPAMTVSVNVASRASRVSLLLSKDKGDRSDGHRAGNEPAMTITANDAGHRRTFLMPGSNASTARPIPSAVPMFTVGDVNRVGNLPRAFLMNEGNPNGNEPSMTVTANDIGRRRAVFIDGQQTAPDGKGGRRLTMRKETEPVVTIAASNGNSPHMAIINTLLTNARVVQMTVRALARFQSFPDWYQFPAANAAMQERMLDKYFVNGERPSTMDRWQLEHVQASRALSCRGIGNAVSPKLAEAIGKAWGESS